MALKCSFTFKEILIQDGYIKVDQGRFVNRELRQEFEYILSYEKYRGSGVVMRTFHSTCLDLEGGLEKKGYNPLVQAYKHALSLPEFSTATSVDQNGNPGT